jgi:hypothetical protein
MHKKLITACLAVFALAALALPAISQATNSPVITHPTGTILKTGTLIEGTNIGETFMRNTTTGEVTLRCNSATMTGTLTKNETGNVQGEISSAHFTGTGESGKCTGFINPTVDPLGLGTGVGQGWCLKSTSAMATDEFQVQGGKCTEAAKKLEFTLTTGIGRCKYQATKATLRGTFTTHPSDAVMTIPRSGLTQEEKSTETGFTKVEDTIPFNPCPSSSYLEMSFTLETDGVANSGVFISS